MPSRLPARSETALTPEALGATKGGEFPQDREREAVPRHRYVGPEYGEVSLAGLQRLGAPAHPAERDDLEADAELPPCELVGISPQERRLCATVWGDRDGQGRSPGQMGAGRRES